MASRKGKVVIAAVAITAIVIAIVVRQSSNRRAQPLPDGSILVLNRVSFGATNEFSHGSFVEKLRGNIIPTTRLTFLSFPLVRPARLKFDRPPGKSQMIAEFKLVGTNAPNHSL